VQLPLDLAETTPRWRFSRLVERSRHVRRIESRLDRVRAHFPELDGVCIRVGLVRRRGVLGFGSLDPERPAIWVRPRRLDDFTIAHELTHLLQARGRVPRGERACDLFALARSPRVIDVPPGYLALPDAMRRVPFGPREAALLHDAAKAALAARQRGTPAYLKLFERTVAARYASRAAGVLARGVDLGGEAAPSAARADERVFGDKTAVGE
jgi:hypothetical protein